MRSDNNILLVANYPSGMGYAWWLMEVFWLEIAKLNPEVNTYLAFPEVNDVTDKLASSNIKVVELDFNLTDKLKSGKLISFIKSEKISRIYLTDQYYFDRHYWKLRLAGVSHIINHDHTPGDRPDINGLAGWIKSIRNRLPFVTADAVFNVSPLMKQRSIRNGRIPEHKVHTIQNGIAGTETIFSGKTTTLRRELGISEEKTILVTSGRLHPYKRIDHALQIFSNCYKEIPDIHLVVIGDGPDRGRLEKIQKALPCRKSIHFLGFRRDVDHILESSDIALHCAKGEGFSLAILEYMRAGLPVITPDIPSVCQAIRHGKTGYIYKDSDFEEAASFTKKLIKNTSDRLEFSGIAKELVNEDYSLPKTLEQFRDAIYKTEQTERQLF